MLQSRLHGAAAPKAMVQPSLGWSKVLQLLIQWILLVANTLWSLVKVIIVFFNFCEWAYWLISLNWSVKKVIFQIKRHSGLYSLLALKEFRLLLTSLIIKGHVNLTVPKKVLIVHLWTHTLKIIYKHIWADKIIWCFPLFFGLSIH